MIVSIAWVAVGRLPELQSQVVQPVLPRYESVDTLSSQEELVEQVIIFMAVLLCKHGTLTCCTPYRSQYVIPGEYLLIAAISALYED